MRTRDEAWTALDRNFKLFMDCLGKLTEEELTSAQVVGKWTVKDVVAHVWSWVDEAVKTVKAWQARRSWQEGVTYDDIWNEQQVIDRSGLALISVVDGLTGSHRRLVRMLDLVEDERLGAIDKAPWGAEMPLVDFFYQMAGHYLDHVDDLKAYQKHCLEGCD